jgi:hypothetical protein
MAHAPSAYSVEKAMSAATRLRAELLAEDGTLADDDRLLCDILDGQTDVFDQLDRVIEASMADAVLAEMAAARAKRLAERKNRLRDLAARMIEALEVKGSLERASYTASISHRTKALVTDQNALPMTLMRIAPDMVAIARALKDGPVNGAVLSNPTPHLVVRTK